MLAVLSVACLGVANLRRNRTGSALARGAGERACGRRGRHRRRSGQDRSLRRVVVPRRPVRGVHGIFRDDAVHDVVHGDRRPRRAGLHLPLWHLPHQRRAARRAARPGGTPDRRHERLDRRRRRRVRLRHRRPAAHGHGAWLLPRASWAWPRPRSRDRPPAHLAATGRRQRQVARAGSRRVRGRARDYGERARRNRAVRSLRRCDGPRRRVTASRRGRDCRA